MKKQDKDKLRRQISKRYSDIAKAGSNACGCSSSCCNSRDSSLEDLSDKLGYSSEELDSAPVDSNMGLGCGNPQAMDALLKTHHTIRPISSALLNIWRVPIITCEFAS